MRPVDYSLITEKKCAVCKKVKPVCEFNRHIDPSAVITGWRYYSRCIKCNREQCREYSQRGKKQRNARLRRWRRSNSEKAHASDRRKMLMRNYKLTVDGAKKILEANNGKCLICNDKKACCIDHCHKTGRVRGGLCVNCNSFLGRVEANPAILGNMAKYAGIHEGL